MTTWHYEDGRWAETTLIGDAWHEAKNWEAVRDGLGYEIFTELSAGRAAAFEVALYRRTEPPKFLLVFSDGNIWEAMTVATLPDALDLLARYAPIVTAAELVFALGDIRDPEPGGILTEALTHVEANRDFIMSQARREREARVERRRAARSK